MSIGQLKNVIHRIHNVAGLNELGSDGQLMERFVKNRDAHAFELLLERHGPMVLGVCRRVLNQTHDVEDAFQATFLVFMRKAPSIRSRETVGNWLYGVAFRTAMKARSAAAKRKAKEHQVNFMKEQISEPALGDDWEVIQAVLDEELERLPNKYRTLIVLCDLEGKPRKEVAEQLHLVEGTLSSRLATARKMLARKLTKRGICLSAGLLAAILTQNYASASVPQALTLSTIQAVQVSATGNTTVGVISSTVTALTEGVLKAMLLTKLKSAFAVLLVVGMFVAGGLSWPPHAAVAQQPDPKKDPDKKEPEKKDTKNPPAKQPEKKEEPKKVDLFPLDDLKARLKKQEDEIAKVRLTMLKEITDEEKKLADLIKKEQDAQKAGDRDAFFRHAQLQAKQQQLATLRTQIQNGVKVGGTTPAPLTEEQRLGIHVSTPSSTIASQLALPKNQGLSLDSVDADSPAAKAGLQKHDIVLKIDGKPAPSDKKEFHKILTELKADSPVDVVVLRAGKEQTIKGLILPSATAPRPAPSDKKKEE